MNFVRRLGQSRAIACVVALLTFAGGTSPTAAQNPGQVFAKLSEFAALDDKCKVLDADQRRAIDLFADEMRASFNETDKATFESWMVTMRNSVAAIPCDDPRAVAAAGQAKAIAFDRQLIWTARVQAVAQLRGDTLWATMGDVSGLKRSAADHVLTGLAAKDPAAIQNLQSVAKAEATRALSVLCPSMSSNSGKCPALASPAAAPELQFAKMWLARVEEFAGHMAGARADGKPVLPAGVSSWSQLYRIVNMDLALAMAGSEWPCESGDLVVRLDGAVPTGFGDSARGTVYRARDGLEDGRVTVAAAGLSLTATGNWGSGSNTPVGLLRCKAVP